MFNCYLAFSMSLRGPLSGAGTIVFVTQTIKCASEMTVFVFERIDFA